MDEKSKYKYYKLERKKEQDKENSKMSENL